MTRMYLSLITQEIYPARKEFIRRIAARQEKTGRQRNFGLSACHGLEAHFCPLRVFLGSQHDHLNRGKNRL